MKRLQLLAILVLAAMAFISAPVFADEKPADEAATQATAPATTVIPAKEPEKKVVAPASGPLQIKIGDASVKFGLMVQPQADFQQNPAGDYAQNLMIRRARFLIGGQVTKTLFFFFETENSRLGAANAAGTKTMSTGFQTLDAAVEWRPRKAFNLSGGLIRVPTSRDALESASNEFTLDFNTYAFTATTALGGTGGRDTGMMARGYFLHDRLEYRAALIAGMRQNGNTNEFRGVGRLQYNFFDKEVYNFPSYAGSNFGTKKIVALGGSIDHQMDSMVYTTDLFADIPTGFGSALGTITLQEFDGGKTSPTALAESRVATVDGGLFFTKSKFGTWARYEQRDFTAANRDEKKYIAGVNYYPAGNNFNIKLGVGRIMPALGRDMTQVTLQLQVFYF